MAMVPINQKVNGKSHSSAMRWRRGVAMRRTGMVSTRPLRRTRKRAVPRESKASNTVSR